MWIPHLCSNNKSKSSKKTNCGSADTLHLFLDWRRKNRKTRSTETEATATCNSIYPFNFFKIKV